MYIPLPGTPVTLTHIALALFKPNNNVYPIIAPNEGMSVIIPVYNEQDFFLDTIYGVVNQTERPEQIVLSDNGSSDATPQVIQNFLKEEGYTLEKRLEDNGKFKVENFITNGKPKVTLITHRQRQSKAQGINQAVPCVEQPWSLMVDSDTVLDPNFVEGIKRSRYQLKIHNSSFRKHCAEIVKSTAIGASVLPKHRKEAGLEERVIATAREAVYTQSSILIRAGQNHTAVYVTPGCGMMCETKHLYMPDRTVTEDIELVQGMQCFSKREKMNRAQLEELTNKDFKVLKDGHLIGLDTILQDFDGRVFFKDKNVTFVPSVFMHTQDPTSFKGLFRQAHRWSSGLHQLRYLEGKTYLKNSAAVSWTIHGTAIESLVNSAMFLIMPALTISYAITGYGMEPQYLAAYFLLDYTLQSTVTGVGMFRRYRYQGNNRKDSIKKTLLNTPHTVFLMYLTRGIDSLAFLSSYLRVFYETRFKKQKYWSSLWVRPHQSKIEEVKSSLDEQVRSSRPHLSMKPELKPLPKEKLRKKI